MLSTNDAMMLSSKLRVLPILDGRYNDPEALWSALQLIDLLETVESRAKTTERICNAGLCSPALEDRPPSIAWSSRYSDASTHNHEYYILRTGSDRYVLLRGDFYDLDVEIPATRSVLQSLVQAT